MAALAVVAAIKAIAPLWDWLLADVVGLDLRSGSGSRCGSSSTTRRRSRCLLAAIVFAVGVLRSFMSIERTRALLGGRREGVGNVAAAGLGVATPFCSCSAVPAFIGFVSAGVPLGVTLSFLIASPLVNEVAIVLLAGLFGFKIAALYVVSGLTIAIVAGVVLGRMRLERFVEPFVYEVDAVPAADPGGRAHLGGPLRVRARRGALDPRPRLAVPARRHRARRRDPRLGARGRARHLAGSDNPLAVPVAVLLGVPLYSNAAGVLPLIEALHAKGVAMGTLLAFMMAVVALSLPEMILLRRVLKVRLIAIWAATVAVAITFTGLFFNLIL